MEHGYGDVVLATLLMLGLEPFVVCDKASSFSLVNLRTLAVTSFNGIMNASTLSASAFPILSL